MTPEPEVSNYDFIEPDDSMPSAHDVLEIVMDLQLADDLGIGYSTILDWRDKLEELSNTGQ
jgi:hypothetical protein